MVASLADPFDHKVVIEEKRVSGRLRETVRAFRHRNFRIFFFGMFVSFVGTWMQSLAQSWLVYRLTGSALLLGLVGFAGQVPIFLVAPLAGVMADRYRRHRIVMLTQTLAMVQALLLASLTLTGHITVGGVLGLAIMLGVVNAFDMPARQSFMIELVGKDDLMNAIALNSSMINSARVIGPALAGLVVAWLGEGLCFLINAISYLVIIVALLAIHIERIQLERPAGSTLSNLKEGFLYVSHTRPIRALLFLVALVSISGLPYLVLMPIFADQVVGGGPRTLGILMGSVGFGSLGGALTIASRKRVEGLGRIVGLSAGAFGALLLVFSTSRNLMLSSMVLVSIGFMLMLQMPATNTLLQAMVPDRMRGRVMSFYSMSLIGMAPFGSLMAGSIAAHIGAPKTLAAGGVLCLGGALLFLLRLPVLRREALPLLNVHGLTNELNDTDTIESSLDTGQ